MKRSIRVSAVLVMAGTALTGSAYTPAPKPRPDKVFVARTYIRPSGVARWNASEQRKREIIAKLGMLREEVRSEAESYRVETYEQYGDAVIGWLWSKRFSRILANEGIKETV